MTYAEELKNEGMATVLHKLPSLKFGALHPSQEAILAHASPEAMDRYIERVLTATSIDEVLAEDA